MNVPTLVLHGHDDQVVPIANSAEEAVERLPNGTLKVYEGLSHGFFAKHPRFGQRGPAGICPKLTGVRFRSLGGPICPHKPIRSHQHNTANLVRTTFVGLRKTVSHHDEPRERPMTSE
ncbi:MAG: alpha/beta fold hydrolase [Yoonia sp.]